MAIAERSSFPSRRVSWLLLLGLMLLAFATVLARESQSPFAGIKTRHATLPAFIALPKMAQSKVV